MANHLPLKEMERARFIGMFTDTLDKVPPTLHESGEHREAVLIREILAGRRDLFGDLIEPHLDAVWRTVRARMGNDPDIDDVVQQAVVKAFIHLEQFRFEAAFKTWLIRIASNEIMQTWRKRVRSAAVELSAVDAILAADAKDSPFSLCARCEAAGLVDTALATLPVKYRVVIRLRDVEERSITEVAEALCLTTAAVKSRHHRARLRMAKVISELRTVHGRATRGRSVSLYKRRGDAAQDFFNEAPQRSAMASQWQ
jgi:RNA polymerase sigma-70 factor (ECF subfamily)